MGSKNYYAVLEVPSTASEEDVRKAYRRLAKELHPDRNPGNPAAEQKFKELVEAFQTIGNPDKRTIYDLSQGQGPSFPRSPFHGRGQVDFSDPFADLYKEVLNRTRRRQAGNFKVESTFIDEETSSPSPGTDLNAEVIITLEEAVAGCTKEIRVQAPNTMVPCQECRGSGARANTPVAPCASCAGSGKKLDFRMEARNKVTQCPACRGRGTKPLQPCPSCVGLGGKRFERCVKVRIPSGVQSGSNLRVAGHGAPGSRMAPGDLFVKVVVAPHRTFTRNGNDIRVRRPVSIVGLLRGTRIESPVVGGPPVTVDIPAGTSPGDVIVVPGAGIEGKLSQVRGDLHVLVEVEIPKSLTPRGKALLEELAEEIERASVAGNQEDVLPPTPLTDYETRDDGGGQ